MKKPIDKSIGRIDRVIAPYMQRREMRPGKQQAERLNKIIGSILVNMAPSKLSFPALKYAIRLAGLFDARLYVIDVIRDRFADFRWDSPLPALEREYKLTMEQVRDQVKAVVEEEKSKGFVVESVFREGEPVKQITRVIEEMKIDLLVLPSHEEDRIEHLLFGRVNHTLARELPCTILLFKH